MGKPTPHFEQEHLDAEGFLKQMSVWSRELAVELARRNDMPDLTEDHWRVIEFARWYYTRHGRGPTVVAISKDTGMTTRQVCDLFPCDVLRGAYRLAGLAAMA